jgi:hypothetical protein
MLRVRQNEAHMNPNERAAFINAVLRLKRSGRYDIFVQLHAVCFKFNYI